MHTSGKKCLPALSSHASQLRFWQTRKNWGVACRRMGGGGKIIFQILRREGRQKKLISVFPSLILENKPKLPPPGLPTPSVALSSRHRSCVPLLLSFFLPPRQLFIPSRCLPLKLHWVYRHTWEPCLAAGSCVGVEGYRRGGGFLPVRRTMFGEAF